MARRFLLSCGVRKDAIDVQRCPGDGSGGAGEKHVRDNYPRNLKAHRTRAAKVAVALIVIIDADTGTVQDRRRQLDSSCEEAGEVPTRNANDAVAYIIPKRSISTWLAYLNGENVNEDTDYAKTQPSLRERHDYSFRKQESDCGPLIRKLAEQCKKHEDPGDRPASLATACEEFEQRIKPVLNR